MKHLRGNSLRAAAVLAALILSAPRAQADSINSPNITMNVDTNRSVGAGAGNIAVTVNTITLAETLVAEYSAGTGKQITIKAKTGYQFDTTSNITAQSATIGINGGALNGIASVTPTGTANEVVTFRFTSGTNASAQDIVRINGVKLKILSAQGAAGPAQTTMELTSATAGGAFTSQGIVAATITRGSPDRLIFANQPGTTEAGTDLLPAVKIVDFGGNLVPDLTRTISLSLITNPGSATLLGTAQRATSSGVATWVDADNLAITTAASGYVLRATQTGASFLTSDSIDSSPFTVSAGNPGSLVFSVQPSDVSAGNDITLTVSTVDEFGNPTTDSGVEVTLDSASNPGGWPLLVDTSLTKETTNGVAEWQVADHLRVQKALSGYVLSASGLGASVSSEPFDIVAGAAATLRFVQGPTTTAKDAVMVPPVTVEIIDQFGNRTTSSSTVTLAPVKSKCAEGLTGNTAVASSGLATFDSLIFGTPCDENVLSASVSQGISDGASNPFNIKAADAAPVSVQSMQLKRNKLFQFKSVGTFTLPTNGNDKPNKKGATLTVTGATGKVKYTLPKGGWRALGNNGSKGFQFSGAKCESVIVKRSTLSATCRGKTGNISIPDDGPMNIVLKLGSRTKAFCGQCGGTTQGDPSKIFKRTSCSAAALCP